MARKEDLPPPSKEAFESLPLSDKENEALAWLEEHSTDGYYDPDGQPVDDRKRPPFPEEEEWGVPGAEGSQ